jgi:hypothetical protein
MRALRPDFLLCEHLSDFEHTWVRTHARTEGPDFLRFDLIYSADFKHT